MILLDRPYVSSFLQQSLVRYNIPAIATPAFKTLPVADEVPTIAETEAIASLLSTEHPRLLCNSENAIDWIMTNLSSSDLPGKIQLFKDKYAFRNLLAEHFPDFFYTAVETAALATVDTSQWPWPVVVKPAIGFFSMAVHRVNDQHQWQAVVEQIQQEVNEFHKQYPQQVLDGTRFIVEQCIAGEEYALDAYYDEQGAPVILNVLHHRFTSGDDVGDRIYTTAADMVLRLQEPLSALLTTIGTAADLRNFPVHLEVRITSAGAVIPIELNPMRFAGWCTSDIAYHAYGFNPYQYYFENLRPDWEQIEAITGDRLTSFIILELPAHIRAEQVKSFDYVRIIEELDNPIELRKVNFFQYPVFGIIFAQTLAAEQEELDQLLIADMAEYIELA
ncbi:MAG: ATP-grasp domain-containing protein [Desulfuromonas sp.]|nr:ATP-grasp domain-containing protein [Desulfuromonas sp.]